MKDQRKRRMDKLSGMRKRCLRRLVNKNRAALEIYRAQGWHVQLVPYLHGKAKVLLSKRLTFPSGEPEYYLSGSAEWNPKQLYPSLRS
jgi:hypothetical protein